jgi:predicted ester cyclase
MQSSELKQLLLNYRMATASFEIPLVAASISQSFADDAVINLCHPFGPQDGAAAFLENCLLPLHQAMPDLERRDMILLAGTTAEGQDWIGCMGNYMGTFLAPFLDIPPTGQLAHMRYHEYFRVENEKVVEVQAIWDIPELMMQADAWPMAPQLGARICTPAPMTCDGLSASGDGSRAMKRVTAMLDELGKHPSNPDPSVMKLESFWHPQFNWYGPAGIGTARGIRGFRNWHQIPFLRAMPDRGLDEQVELTSHWIAEGDYVCETGWPNMSMTLSDDGWMGVAPSGRKLTLRSLDFWRLENDLIRENWVLVDLLDFYQQVGVDVLGRLREFNKARNLQAIPQSDVMTSSR